MFDHLWNESPMVQKMRDESKAQGALEEIQRMLVNIVKARFPSLADLAQQKAVQMSNIGAIELLVEQVATANDESIVRWLLSPAAA